MPGPAISTLRVRDVMRIDVKTLDRNDRLSIADDLMTAERVRHLPVLDEDGELCGIVSQRDLFRGALAKAIGYGESGQRKLLGTLAVKEVMTTGVVTVEPETRITDAAALMLQRRIGCLPVVEGGRLVGIVTESDLVRLVAGETDVTKLGGTPP
jgi:CBS domain-containing membrane protein